MGFYQIVLLIQNQVCNVFLNGWCEGRDHYDIILLSLLVMLLDLHRNKLIYIYLFHIIFYLSENQDILPLADVEIPVSHDFGLIGQSHHYQRFYVKLLSLKLIRNQNLII